MLPESIAECFCFEGQFDTAKRYLKEALERAVQFDRASSDEVDDMEFFLSFTLTGSPHTTGMGQLPWTVWNEGYSLRMKACRKCGDCGSRSKKRSFLMKQYRALIRNNFGRVLAVALLSVISSFAMVFAGYSLSFLYAAYEYDGDKIKALLYTFLIVLGIWLIAMLCCYMALLAKAKMQQSMKNELRRLIGNKIAALDYPAFVNKDSGNYVSWLTNDADQIYSQSFTSLFTGIESLATALFLLAHFGCSARI